MHNKPLITLMLDSRRALASGLFPVRLRATFQVVRGGTKRWLRRYYPTGVNCSRVDYASIMGHPRRADLQLSRTRLLDFERRANKVLEMYEHVTPELMDAHLLGPGLKTVGELFDRVIRQMKQEDRIGNAKAYISAKGSLTEYAGEGLTLAEISTDWLKRYQMAMLKGGKSQTTVSMYLRALRKIYNDALEMRIITPDLYPFGARRFSIQSVRKPKMALSEKQKNAVLGFVSDDETVMMAVDFWAFSYFCNGMSMADVFRLRRSSIRDGKIYFERVKIRLTTPVVKTITVIMRPEVKAIIARRGIKSLDPAGYVFPVLQTGLVAVTEKNRIQRFIKKINAGLRIVARELKLPFKLTTYTARHTFSNISLLKGGSKEYIQEALGHQSMQTTENYISGFDDETRRRMVEKL